MIDNLVSFFWVTIYQYTYECIYIYIHKCNTIYNIYTSLWLTFAQNRRNFFQDCNLLCCFSAYFLQTAIMQNIAIACVLLHICACLRQCQNHLLNPDSNTFSVICRVSTLRVKSSTDKSKNNTTLIQPKISP